MVAVAPARTAGAKAKPPCHNGCARLWEMMSAADLNVLVMEWSVPTAHNAERFMQVLRRVGVDMDRIRVVVNRATEKADVDPVDVEKLLKARVAWSIPNDFRTAIASINVGEPVVLRAPRAELSTSLGGLAASLNGKA